jgi:hypothetical protein
VNAVDLIGTLLPLTFFVMLAIESLWPARRFPPRRAWCWTGIGFLVLLGVIFAVVPLLIDAAWAAHHRWLNGRPLGVVGGTLVGYLPCLGCPTHTTGPCIRSRSCGA